MRVEIHGLRNFNHEEKEKIVRTLRMGSPVLASEVWADKISRAKFTEAKGMNGAQIVKLIRTGADDKGKVPDGDLDIDISGFFDLSKTVGYTHVGGFTTYMNRRFLRKFEDHEVFGHCLHELMHRAYGFVHRFRHATSVPYVVGYKSREAFREFYLNPNPVSLIASAVPMDLQWSFPELAC